MQFRYGFKAIQLRRRSTMKNNISPCDRTFFYRSQRRWFYPKDFQKNKPNQNVPRNWLRWKAFVHEIFSASTEGLREEDIRKTRGENWFWWTSNFNASSIIRETKPTQTDQCPLADEFLRIRNCPLFKNMNNNDQFLAWEHNAFVTYVCEQYIQS